MSATSRSSKSATLTVAWLPVDFAPQRAGHGEAGRQVVAGRDSQPFDAVFELVQLAVEADLAVAQNRHALGHPFQVARDVRAEQDRVPVVFEQFQQRSQKLPPGRWVEAGHRLVEHQQLGLMAERQHDADGLQLAGGKRPTRSSSGTCQRSQSSSTNA